MRRTALIVASLTLPLAPLVGQSAMEVSSNSRSTSSTNDGVREQDATQQAMQALNRLSFGPKPGDLLLVRNMGVDAWIDRQLHPERIDDGAIEQLLARYPLVNQSQNDLARDYAALVRARAARKASQRDTGNAMDADEMAAFKKMNQGRAQLVAQLESSRIARAVSSDRQLLEVMTDFWENHFNVYVKKGGAQPYYLVDYDREIRAHALGKFRDLLGVVAHSPAMLYYLDNAQSRANPGQPTLGGQTRAGRLRARLGARNIGDIIKNSRMDEQRKQRAQKLANAAKKAGLNENYGRELLELHTLGVDGGYTQQDVIDVARALTGWTIRPPAQGGGFIFRPEWHDAGEKTILGQKFPANKGEDEGERVLDLLARQPATARFIATKLAQRLVSDSPSTALVQRAANTFLRTDGDIREVVRTLVTSPEFFSAKAYRSKVKSPFEVVVSAARAMGGRPDTTPGSAFAVAYLGQPLFGHQAPNGWPETGDAWMNTGAILNRINFGMAVGANRLPGSQIRNFPGADSLRNAPRDQQVDAVVQTILGGAVSPDTRKILMSGEHPLAAAAANAPPAPGITDDDDEGDSMMNARQRSRLARPGAARNAFTRSSLGPPPALSGLAQVVGLAIGSPEFQRR